MTSGRVTCTFLALFMSSPAAHAASITLEELTTPIVLNAEIKEAPEPIASGIGNAVASGLIWTGGTGLAEGFQDNFVAWCFDLIHPVSLGTPYEYEIVDAPYANSYLLNGADARVSSLFNANYDDLDVNDSVQAAAFQLAVWEVANDDDFDISGGAFQAAGFGDEAAEITAAAQIFLSEGESYDGPSNWQSVFLETREENQTQNLVTASRTADVAPVPIPASGLFLVAGLAGLAGLRRRQLG